MDYFDILFAKNNGISKGTCYNETEAMLEATVGHSCKNLLEITAETKTTNGVTFTSDIVNGTITAEGQTTNTSEGSQYNFQGDGLRVINNIESGMLMSLEVESTPTITSGAYLAIGYYNSQQNYISEQRCTISVGELALSIPSNAAYYRLFVRKTRTAGGITVVYKPMLRDGSISDDTFEPYVTPTDEKKQDKIKTLYVAPSLEDATNEIIVPRSNDINFFIVVCLAGGDTDKAVTFILPQELFGYPCVNGDFSITGSVVDSSHNKLTFGFPNTFSAGKIIRVLGVPNISYEAEEVN